MKSYKQILQLSLVWAITILAFAISFSVYGASIMMSAGDGQSPMLYFIISFCIIFCFALVLGFISSVPAFVFFGLFSFLVLQIPMDLRIKKIIILAINYMDILCTCAFTFAIIASSTTNTAPQYSLYPLKNYILWYPNWVIILTSTIAILLMPFGKNNTN